MIADVVMFTKMLKIKYFLEKPYAKQICLIKYR